MNFRRYTMTSLSIVFLALTIMSVSAIGQNAYAAGGGMSLSAEGSGATVAVSGTTDKNDEPVMLVLSNSLGIHGVDQLTVSGGSYSTSINVSALDDGTYTIKVNQGTSGKYTLSVDIDVSGGSSDSSASVSNQIAATEEEATSTTPSGGLTLTAGGIEGSTTIDVSGTTDRGDDITLKVIAPNGNVITTAQITPSGGSFMTTIETGGALWSQDGMYTISAYQGQATKYQASAEIEVVDGHVIPEFGTIAVMILVVAIVSIIIVSAKTKLSLVPRY